MSDKPRDVPRELEADACVVQSVTDPFDIARVGDIYQAVSTGEFFQLAEIFSRGVLARPVAGYSYLDRAGKLVTGPVRGVYVGEMLPAAMPARNRIVVELEADEFLIASLV